MGLPALLGEAVVLGLASGPACIASCGPVLVPSLLGERAGFRHSSAYLGTFLSTRFIGYLLFAVVAAAFGKLASLATGTRVAVFGVVHVALGIVLLLYARSVGRACSGEACGSSRRLVQIGGEHCGVPGAALLGLLTGVSLCPPFVAAGVRAAELGSVSVAVIFFVAFFFGTSVWFVPFLGVGRIHRNEAVMTVARMAMVLVALYYAWSGVAMLIERNLHGY